jgi:pimeloyl-ACP methyl ester carboxylesterase
MPRLLSLLRSAGRYLLVFLIWLIHVPRFLLKSFLVVVAAVLTIILGVALVEMLWVSPRNIAYRYVSPASSKHPNACDAQRTNSTILARFDNSEDKAQLSHKGEAGLECMLQYHAVPTLADPKWYDSDKPIGPIGYYLSFVEFQESGRLAEKGLDNSLLEHSQLQVLEDHLSKQQKNYVLVFIHGWRHDARIGDDNVANARVYAAHAASALDYRCKTKGRDCDYTVTAVFVGWRGARVDESAIEAFADRHFGFLGKSVAGTFKAVVGDIPASLTLFDRKPISERIAPSVVASLRHVDSVLKARNAAAPGTDRLIVIGHSLGGNILATGLNSAMIDQIRLHKPGDLLRPPLGNLVVLINPAAEAWKWTSIQHEMRLHVQFPDDTTKADAQAKMDAGFFSPNQPPFYISITSAFAWPAAALTQLELQSLGGRDPDTDEMKSLAQYDAATHDAFPFFKGNFQPLSDTLDRLASWFPQSKPGGGIIFPDKSMCGGWKMIAIVCEDLVIGTLKFAAAIARNVPFTNADSDDTLTIGHMNPMRPPYGEYTSTALQSPLPYGTTSELIVNNFIGHPTLYTNAGSAYLSECAIVDHWLWKARHNLSLRAFEGWDSGFSHIRNNHQVVPDKDTPNVTPIRPRPTDNGHLEVQFRQYLLKSGTESIITSNDPMWNIRAYDTTLAFHGGYVSYPLICALNQLVMDDVASEPTN